MSDNVPLEIQEKIIKTLPIKSLIQFRSVSKTWKSLIDSSDFIVGYSSELQRLLVVSHRRGDSGEQKYVSISDDDTFPQHKVSLNPPLLVTMLRSPEIIGCSHGLLCLKGNYPEDNAPIPARKMVVLWNLSIRKAVAAVLPYAGFGTYKTVVGFSVCPETNDPMIVNLTLIKRWSIFEPMPPFSWKVDVFKLSRCAWRSVYSNPRCRPGRDFGSQVVVNGFIYWLAFEAIPQGDDDDDDDDEYDEYNVIVSFDLTFDEFREVKLPDSLAHGHSNEDLYISKLRKSLVVLERDKDERGFVVWMMEEGVRKSFTKLFHILTPNAVVKSVLEFRKSGEPVIHISKRCCKSRRFLSQLVVYEPHSKHINYLGIGEIPQHVYSYGESLLLLDQPNFIIYDAVLGKSYISNQTDSNQSLLMHTSKGKMKADEVKIKPSDNVLGENMDMMKQFDSKSKEWIESKKNKCELKPKD